MRRQVLSQEEGGYLFGRLRGSALYNFWPMRLARLYSLVRF